MMVSISIIKLIPSGSSQAADDRNGPHNRCKERESMELLQLASKEVSQVHNIDLTKLQSYTAEELLELLISVHPDISHALYTYLRMGDTGMTITAKKRTGTEDKSGQRTLDELREMLNTPLPSPGYQHGRSLEKLDTIQRLMVMVRGACAGEVVLNESVHDVVEIVPVDPSLIWFRRHPGTNRLVPWQYVNNPRMQQGET